MFLKRMLQLVFRFVTTSSFYACTYTTLPYIHAQKLISLMQRCSLTTPNQYCYQGSTTIVELTMLMSIVQSIVARC